MRPRVLVVEDQEMVMEQICDFLEWVGCEVVARARNGAEAVERYAEHRPDLVTMDLIMPQMDGAEATRVIRETDPSATIVLFTSLDVNNGVPSEEGLVRKGLANGARAAVGKFSKDRIATELKSIFGDRIDL